MPETEIVYLALGSNLGDRRVNLRQAIEMLSEQIKNLKLSSIYETPPWGVINQPAFLNQVICGQTRLDPIPLLYLIKQIEKEMGRVETIRNGPRLIDIDILFYGQRRFESPELSLPHPRMQGRAFVWLPLAELAPDLLDPRSGKTAAEIVQNLDTSEITNISNQAKPSF